MLLLPEQNAGLFVSTNTQRGDDARFEFVNAFLDRYHPVPEVVRMPPPEDFKRREAQFTGTYYPARMSFSTLEKTVALVEPVQVSATEDGLLQTTGLTGGDPVFWVEEQPGIFRSTSESLPADTRLVFKADPGGDGNDIRYAFFGSGAYIKQPWYGSSSFQYLVIGLSLVCFLAAAIALPAGALLQRRYRNSSLDSSSVETGGARLARWTGLLLALLSLAFWVVFFILTSDLNSLTFGLPPLAKAVLLLPWVILPLTGLIVIFAWLAWRRKYWTRTGRVLYTILAVAGVAHVWFLVYWNLLF
jgi:hypothetical protein